MSTPTFYHGDCLAVMRAMPPASVDAVVTDPPYDLTANKRGGMGTASVNLDSPYGRARIGTGNGSGGFMGQAWDATGIAFRVELWQEVLRVLKPGGHLLAFGGTRTSHRMVCAIEDAGFEIRDSLCWVYACLSADSEILTDHGWEPYHKLIVGQHVLCYNAEQDTFAWEPIQEVVTYAYADTAYRIHSDSTDQLVSRNHRCLVERGGNYVFQVAEEVARERTARVPVLEKLPALLAALPVREPDAGNSQRGLLSGVCSSAYQSATARGASEAAPHDNLPPMSPGIRDQDRAARADLLQLVLPGQSECGETGYARGRGTGAGRMDGDQQSLISGENDRAEQSGLERRHHVLQDARQLPGGQVRALPGGISEHGTQGRLCDGAPAVRGRGVRAASASHGGSASPGSRSDAQRAKQSGAIRQQPGSQVVRGQGYTRSDLAVITPQYYEGVVWCVRVPSGAFVARRKGKAFVTGNSGFPKSLDISKALDKRAGAERAVVGLSPRHGGGTNYVYGVGMGDSTVPPVTAPATDLAARWDGWGTALKPAQEPIVLARAPLSESSVAANVARWGTGGINISGSKVGIDTLTYRSRGAKSLVDQHFGQGDRPYAEGLPTRQEPSTVTEGRWPPNLLLSHAPACNGVCVEGCPVAELDAQSGQSESTGRARCTKARPVQRSKGAERERVSFGHEDAGGASRFYPILPWVADDVLWAPFYFTPKPSRAERDRGCETLPAHSAAELVQRAAGSAGMESPRAGAGRTSGGHNSHPTVKPVALMRWLCTLITPPGGIVLDPFGGSGTTIVAADQAGFQAIYIDQDAEYGAIARARFVGDAPLFNGGAA